MASEIFEKLLNMGLAQPELDQALHRFAGGVFSDREIHAAITTGQIVLNPYNPSRVQNSSVDVSLGRFFYKMERDPHQGQLNPFDQDSILDYFKPLEALPHKAWLEIENLRTPFSNIPLDQDMFLIRPNERILAHTREFVGIAWGGTTMMHAKSTIGRFGISVCDDAGWGDQGYINRWTMEIKNKNEHASVPLVVGMPIAQLIFFKMTGSEQRYGNTGHYQHTTDLEQLRADWTPRQMLPRLMNVIEAS